MEYQSIAPLGKVNIVSDTALLGQRGRFLDLDYSGNPDGVKSPQSQSPVIAILVYNNSGGTLAAGTMVKWDNGATYGPFRGVIGAAAVASDEVPAGVVDPWISSPVPIGGIFWLIIEGPCKFLFTTGTTLDEGDLLAIGASGRAAKFVPETTDPVYHVGRSLAAVDTAIASDTLFRGYAQFKF